LVRRFQSRTATLAAVVKSQVFALKLNREEFAKKSIDLIRRKFSIDVDLATGSRLSTISKPYRHVAGNPPFTIRVDWLSHRTPKAPWRYGL
jgi:hypothetical protein